MRQGLVAEEAQTAAQEVAATDEMAAAVEGSWKVKSCGGGQQRWWRAAVEGSRDGGELWWR